MNKKKYPMTREVRVLKKLKRNYDDCNWSDIGDICGLSHNAIYSYLRGDKAHEYSYMKMCEALENSE